MPRLVLTGRARRELNALGLSLAEAVTESLAFLQREPDSGEALRGRMRGLLVLRVGAYRIIYQLVDGGKTIRVAAIRHRATAYLRDPR